MNVKRVAFWPWYFVVSPAMGYTTDRILDCLLGPEDEFNDYVSTTSPSTPPPF